MTDIIMKKPTKAIEDISIEDLRALSNDNFLMWCMTSGAKVDNNEIDFDTHRYLIPIYLDNSDHIVWQKAAQLGATVYMLLRTLWWLEKNQGRKAGLYFPTNDGVQNLSKDRLVPLIDSCPSIKAISPDSGKLNLRHVGSSSFYLYHLGGVASKDSVPLDFVCFDEVRLCDAKDIDQALHRISHSPYKYRTFMSTCIEGNTTVVVREKSTGFVTKKSFKELEHTFTNYQVLSYNRIGGYRPRWRDIKAVHNNGVKKVVKASFTGHNEIVCTPDHKFAVSAPTKALFGYNSFVEIQHIERHNESNTPAPVGVYALTEIPTDVGVHYDLLTFEFMGLFIAEGVYKNGTVSIYQNVTGEKHEAVRDIAKQWAMSNGLEYLENTDGVHVSGITTRPDLVQLFQDCGTLASEKRIPEILLQGNKPQLTHLMNGLIAGDGWYIDKDLGSFGISTSSKQLASDIRFVALKIGSPVQTSVRNNRVGTPVVIDGVQTGTAKHKEHILRYSPLSHRHKEIVRGVGKLALSSVADAGEAEVYDMTVDQDAWYFLAESGILAKNCGLPDNDINRRWQQGTQHIWMSACGCPDGCDLARTFPDCIVTDDPKRPGEVYLRCPKCRYEIKDAQNGRYVPMNPSADYHSYHVSQLASKYRSTKEVWTEFLNTTNIEEFYNAALGIPYIDSANRGVTPSQLEACVNPQLRWMKDERKEEKTRTAMGVDQGGAYNMVVIADIAPDGTRKRIRHVEIIEQLNPQYYEDGNPVSPFNRLYKLMDEFNVGICVIDMMPNYNEALKFAQAFPGRVFLAYYKRDGKEVVQWGDRGKYKENVRKAGPLLKFKYQCAIGRFPSLSFALGEWAEGNVQIPPLDGIRQIARSEEHDSRGQLIPESPARRLFSHLPRLIKRWTEVDAETGSGRWEWVYAGGDPHLAHAWNYCNIALERIRRKAVFAFG